MPEALRRALPLAVGGAAAVLAAVVAGPAVARLDDRWSLLAYQSLVVVVGAALGLVAVRPAWPRPDPPPPESPPAGGPPRLPELEALESLVADAGRHAGHLHHRLRPRLRVLAADALASRQVDLDDDEGAARRLLGERAWAVLGPSAAPPSGRHGGGPGVDEVARIVAAVARLQADPRPDPPAGGPGG